MVYTCSWHLSLKMNKKDLESLSNEEIGSLVVRLQEDVQCKTIEVESINKELMEIKTSIHQQQTDRQKFTAKLFQTEEAAQLVEENKKLQRELKEKQDHLSKLSKGEAKEQSEVKELESRLHELTTSSEDELKSLEEKNQEYARAIQDLEAMYREKQVACQTAKDDLSNLQEEVDRLKNLRQKQASSSQSETRSKSKTNEQLKLSKKLDKLILKTSQEAGLKL